MNAHLDEIQRIIDNDIAPARQLGFRVDGYDEHSLNLRAPLTLNTNHHGTAFGGSLFSLAAVCGWGFVLLKLREADLHGTIVVKSSEVAYLAPVSTDLSVRCGAKTQAVESFLARYRQTGRARLEIQGQAPADHEQPALTLKSTYSVFGADKK